MEQNKVHQLPIRQLCFGIDLPWWVEVYIPLNVDVDQEEALARAIGSIGTMSLYKIGLSTHVKGGKILTRVSIGKAPAHENIKLDFYYGGATSREREIYGYLNDRFCMAGHGT